MLKIGDKLPAGSLQEFIEVEGNGCAIGPNTFDIAKLAAGKKIAIFGLPGAYTPTCSAQHVPGYVAKADALKAAGVDEIWCVSVNDAFVMAGNLVSGLEGTYHATCEAEVRPWVTEAMRAGFAEPFRSMSLQSLSVLGQCLVVRRPAERRG